MNEDIVKDLEEANIKGLCPPQNWTHRAIETISSLRAELVEKEKEIDTLNNRIGAMKVAYCPRCADSVAITEKAEAELAEVRERLKEVEEVYKQYHDLVDFDNNDYFDTEVEKVFWQAIKQAVGK